MAVPSVQVGQTPEAHSDQLWTPPSSAGPLTNLKYRVPGRYIAAWAVFLILGAVVAIVTPTALGSRSIWVVTALAGILALAAFGQMLVVMMGHIDLSVPSIMAATTGVVVHYGGEGSSLPLVLLSALLVGVVLSLFNGVLISVFRLNSVVVTLATFGLINGLILMWTGVAFSASGEAPARLQVWANWRILNVSSCLVFAAVVAAILAFVLWKTRGGRQVAAAGSNRRAAELLGVRVKSVELATFATTGLLYGLAGVLLAGFVGAPDVAGTASYQLATITAVAIAGVSFGGGSSSIATVLVACLFLQLLDGALAIQGLSAGGRVVAQGLALVAALAAIRIGRMALNGLRRARR